MFSTGTAPNRLDTRWKVLVRWLQAVQDNLAGAAFNVNNPTPRDTRRVLLYKTNAALAGVPWTSG